MKTYFLDTLFSWLTKRKPESPSSQYSSEVSIVIENYKKAFSQACEKQVPSIASSQDPTPEELMTQAFERINAQWDIYTSHKNEQRPYQERWEETSTQSYERRKYGIDHGVLKTITFSFDSDTQHLEILSGDMVLEVAQHLLEKQYQRQLDKEGWRDLK